MVGLSRVFAWFWPRAGLPRDSAAAPAPGALAWMGRARTALQVGEQALHPFEPLAYEGGEGVACELYRQAAVFALLANAELDTSGASAANEPTPAALPWARLDAPFLEAAAGDAAALAELRTTLEARSTDLAVLPREEQRRLAARLRAFAEALLVPLDGPARQRERVWVRRVARVGALAVVLSAFAFLVIGVKTWQERQLDLAARATWTASSVGYASCKSPEQRCKESPTFFFHTANEANPWVTFDLKAPKYVSAVFVENRRDCCAERAIPLVIEVSNDNKRFREVARQKDDFTTLAKRFSRVKARYVRLRVDKTSMLHLATVRILP